MNTKLILAIIIILVLVLGCNSEVQNSETQLEECKSKLEQLQDINENLEQQLELLNIEYNNAQEVKEALVEQVKGLEKKIVETVELDEDTKQILSYINSYNGRIFPSDYQPSYHIAWMNSNQPIRIFPSLFAPYIDNDRITYSFNDENEVKKLVEVYAFVNSKRSEGWGLVNVNNFNFGYIEAKYLETYIPEGEVAFISKEQFKNIKLGITVDEIFNKYKGRIEVLHERNGYSQMIQIRSVGIEDINSFQDEEISFYYDLISRRINFIRTTSDKYVLESGYKVGDNTEEVFKYYDSRYELIEAFSSENYRRYNIGNGYSLDIGGDINEDGKVYIIIINGGYNIYA